MFGTSTIPQFYTRRTVPSYGLYGYLTTSKFVIVLRNLALTRRSTTLTFGMTWKLVISKSRLRIAFRKGSIFTLTHPAPHPLHLVTTHFEDRTTAFLTDLTHSTASVLRRVDVSSVATEPTSPGTASPLHLQTDGRSFSQNHLAQNLVVTRTEKPIASVGMDFRAGVPSALAAGANMHAPSVEIRTTIPNHAPLSTDFLPIVTPFIPDAWESILRDANLFTEFSDVPYGLRHGFDMGVHSLPASTYIPANHSSALNHPSAILSYIRKELSLGRYTGPFSQSRLELLIGPFRTSPLGLTPKPGADEFRLVQDFSYPRNDPHRFSVNSEIDTDDFRCDWGTFQDVVAIVIDAPPYSLAATLDVDAAFRRCPISPSQQPNFVIGWNGLFYIDHNAPFGAASSGGVFGRVADAMMAILRAFGIGPAKNWVDDFLFFLLPTNPPSDGNYDNFKPIYPYDLNTIYALAAPLGWPWKESKTRPFAPRFKYLGFIWDLIRKTVEIPEDKKSRYLTKITPWIEGAKFTRRDTESILGTLVHCSLAIPDGRSHLPSLARFAASFQSARSVFIHKTPNSSVLSDISWWRSQLSLPFAGFYLKKPPPLSPVSFWVDASTSWGIGVIFNDFWDAWKFRSNWNSNGRNIGWAEFVAIELGILLAVSHGFSNIHFLIRSDNQGVIHAIQGGRSRSPEQNIVLQRINYLLSTNSIWISSLYVPSSSNLADRPSRGLPPLDLPRSSTTFPLPSALVPFLTLPSILIP